MKPAQIMSLPHNRRCEIYNSGEGPSFMDYAAGEAREPAIFGLGEYLDPPFRMPDSAILWTDGDEGAVIAAFVVYAATEGEQKRIRWEDLDIFTAGIQQYNERIARLAYAEGTPTHE